MSDPLSKAVKKETKPEADHFTYRLSWSAEDGEHVATCAEFPSLSHLAAGPEQALRGIRDLVRDVVADMRANGERVPEAIADQAYSGKFMTRIPRELHRRLTIEAAEAGVSLNRLVSLRLAVPIAPVHAESPMPDANPGASARSGLAKRRVG